MVLSGDPFCLIASSRAAKCPSSEIWLGGGGKVHGRRGREEGGAGKGGIKMRIRIGERRGGREDRREEGEWRMKEGGDICL